MNAVVERKRPLTALLVTDGFRDILSIRDEHRYEMFDSHRISRNRWFRTSSSAGKYAALLVGTARDDVRRGGVSMPPFIRRAAPRRRTVT
jgi:Hydantoinase/oxoprolinase N-terminal region